jgi:tetratricopeptide (TPR) repeat protein/tRNA A-37 threonylcarbamoyl transferase component Bud32
MSATQLIDLAAAIADGTPIDWTSFQSDAMPAATDLLVRARIVQRIAQVHAELPPADSFSSSLHKSLLGVTLPGDGAEPSESPVTWGPLIIVGRIGRGSFGDVYRAHDPRLNRSVALKLLRRKDRFESAVIEEGHLMARVRHPNVVTVYGAERIDGRVGLWMELVDGLTLEQELKARRPFTAEEVARVGIDVARALGAVHRAGLLHRDLKAQNVMRDADGRVLLTDFGAGRELAESSASTTGLELAGTPLYLAPEVLEGKPASRASDIYSLGVLLYHLATGSFPVRARSLRDLREAHESRRRTLRDVQPDFPKPLADVIDRALSRNPSDRYQTAADLESALEQLPQRTQKRWVAWGAAAMVSLTVAGGVVAWKLNHPPVAARLALQPRDVILITRFENRTGETVFDGTLEYALERELANSSFVNIATRERVADTLRLMQKPVETPLDETVSREIALRDGEIRAFVSGRIAKVGDSYAISADIRRSADGSIVASVKEASTRSEVLSAVGRIALGIRQRMGETLSSLDRTQTVGLAKVTTSSLRALQLYSQVAAMEDEEGGWYGREKTAERLLREAIDEDPDFASAHMRLSIAIRLDGQTTGHSRLFEALEHAQRAVALSGSVSNLERLLNEGELLGVQAFMSGDSVERDRLRERAAAAFSAALQLHPNHSQALICLTNIQRFLQKPNAAIARQLADLRPTSVVLQQRAALDTLTADPHNTDLANRYLQRARRIPPVNRVMAFAAAWVRLYEAGEAWRRNNPSEALRVVDRMANEATTLAPEAAYAFNGELVGAYLGLGQIERAAQVAEAGAPAERKRLISRTVAAREDAGALRAFLQRELPNPADGIMSLFIDARLLNEAHQLIAALQRRVPAGSAFLLASEGQLALAEGRLEEAIALLERSQLGTVGQPYALAAVKLADAWIAKGDRARAIAALEDASARRDTLDALPLTWGLAWLRVRERLARLYREAGRVADAKAIESELRQLLVVADDDHPIKRRLFASKAEN